MQLPARIGKYELEEFLGGGMAHVYRARDTLIGRTVAVKILTEEGCANADTKARFLQEARLAGSLQHDNIISIYDYGEDEQKRPYIVMEFLRGEDLRQAIKNGHTGALPNRLRIGLQIVRALAYIHSRKIIHRDVKPENIHIAQSGAVKLMDFGIAKAEGMAKTRTGYVMGSPYYMAPEQVRGEEITELIDIYAFGVMFCELLTGVRPLSGDKVERIFYIILNEPLDLEPLHKAGVPPKICDLIARCTAKDPEARPQSFDAVALDIEEALGEKKPTGPDMPAARGSRKIAAVLAVAVLLAAGGLAVLARNHRTAAPPQLAAVPQVSSRQLLATIADPSGDMVLVPGGEFLSGKDKKPVILPDFYIDRTEVTRGAYLKFCRLSGRSLPDDLGPGQPDLPVVHLTIADAKAFAAWAKKRLPTSDEWEKAARGLDGRLFPWGDAPDAARANVQNSPGESGGPTAVGSFPSGASVFGALDMVGNVWEFTDTEDAPQPNSALARLLKPAPRPDEKWYRLRGGSFDEPLDATVLWDWASAPARHRDAKTGFRCARSARRNGQ